METKVTLSEYELERHKPMPSLNHSFVQKNILVGLDVRYRQIYTLLSELSLDMPEKPDTVPDICIYPKLEIDFLRDRTSLSEMPLTAIEIISASQSNDDILANFERYFNAGVKSCWLVMPSLKAVAVYSAIGVYQFFTEADTLHDAVTGVDLPLREVFS